MSWVEDVENFHAKFGVPIGQEPAFPHPSRRRLRLALVEEEIEELSEADAYHNLEDTADAIVDSIYVLIGMALEYGIPLDAVWAEVHAANMRKEGGATREDGKILKPPGWVGPDIKKALGL